MADRRSSIGKTWRRGAAVAVVVALIAAVYVTLDRQGNGGDSGVCAAARARAEALDPLVGGEIAALQTAKEPEKLSELAFVGEAGEAKTLADFQGRVALVNLWATWCAPCRKEMPSLDRLQAALGGEDFLVVPISIDTGGRDRPAQFMKSIGVEHLPLYTDRTTKIFEALKGRGLAIGLPVTVLLDRDGCWLGHINGPAEWDSEEAHRLIEAAIRPSEGGSPQG
jgi:thiol-disulfide isomerase/thioredoxin